jgi:ribosomal protein S18 acetylase RimI-like enzyme
MENSGNDIPVTIRSFAPADQPAVYKLYREGLIGDTRIADNDTGFDMDDVESAYMRPAGSHFWVAVNQQGEVVGTIGVQHHEEGSAEIRRLRVRQDHQRRGIGTKLMETAIKYCHENHYLKVTLDTYLDADPATKLFSKFKFRESRSRVVGGKNLRYFYLDLYAGEVRKD